MENVPHGYLFGLSLPAWADGVYLAACNTLFGRSASLLFRQLALGERSLICDESADPLKGNILASGEIDAEREQMMSENPILNEEARREVLAFFLPRSQAVSTARFSPCQHCPRWCEWFDLGCQEEPRPQSVQA